jgi:hypothetical protein
MHFSSRGIYDLIIRMLNQKFKSENIEIINNFLNSKIEFFNNLPSRIKALLIYNDHNKINITIKKPILKYNIDINLEKQFLNEFINITDIQENNIINNLTFNYPDFIYYKNLYLKSINMTQFLLNNYNKNTKTNTKINKKINTKIKAKIKTKIINNNVKILRKYNIINKNKIHIKKIVKNKLI